MKTTLPGAMARLLVPAIFVAGAIAQPAMAQDKKAEKKASKRTHKDGKVEMYEWREGGVYVSPPDTASTKNVGKSAVVIYTGTIK